jgi:hypothetical protein
MSDCISTSEINNSYYFNVGLTKDTIDFNGKIIEIYIYRPITMASNKDVIIHIPGRNGNAKEYIEQTMLMNSYNTKLAVCINMSQFTAYEFEFGNVFPFSDYNEESVCLKNDATFHPSSIWTFNIIFRVLDYLKEKLETEEINYILNGIDAAGFFVSYFHYFYPLIEDSRKQLPEKSIIGVTSFYFFPFSNSRMKLDYIKNVDTSTTATKTYKELINYNCIPKERLELLNNDLVCTINNNTILNVYYQYINNFLSSISDPVNHKVKNIRNTDVYNLSTDMDEQIFPVGTGNIPLIKEKRIELAKLHTGRKILYQFYAKDTNIYGGVDPEGNNIPNISSSCNSEITGPFRLFRGLNAFFSSKIDSDNFQWEYIVIPDCGHSSNFANNTILMSNAINPEFWKNPQFCPQYFYFLKPELFE